ncbi:regulator of chromosome condensation 1/beta-lactamase-inhibitor protein II [Xylaria arbuscula]|nr:regulator of chromosome condensation 1/beta-lactamase-inhibitor protein II [Xylaria arbuscula]
MGRSFVVSYSYGVSSVGSRGRVGEACQAHAAKEARNSTTTTGPLNSSDPIGKRKRPRLEEQIPRDDATSRKRSRVGRPRKDQTKVHSVKSREEQVAAPPAVLNEVPQEILAIFVFGTGENGELGLGPNINEAQRPVLNPFLDPSSPTAYHIVDFACGGMHTVALSTSNRIITWGVNDNGALGRKTDWEGGLRDVDDESDNGEDAELNPLESTPKEIPAKHFPSGTKFAQVAAGDSCSFALTDTGLVYGWGSFRDSQGNNRFGYDTNGKIVKIQESPVQIQGIPLITQIVCGDNHALALDIKGNIWAWGYNEQNQFGRRLFGRRQDSFVPSQVRVCRGKAKYVASGPYHSFAIDRQDNVWAWGANTFGQAGESKSAGKDSAFLPSPVKIRHLCQKEVTVLAGGAFHSAAITVGGQCFVWGRTDYGRLGVQFTPEQTQDEDNIRCDDRGKPRICLRPTAVPNVGHAVDVACGTDHTLFINKSGAGYSSGVGDQGQLGLGAEDEIEVATLIKAKAVRDRFLVRAGASGNSSMVAAVARDS